MPSSSGSTFRRRQSLGRRARGLHPCRPCGRGPGPHAVPGGGEADDRAAAAGAGRWPRAPCRRSGGLRRGRQRGGRARGGRADRGRLRGARRRGRRPRGTRRRGAGDLARGAGQSRLSRPARRRRCGGEGDGRGRAHRRGRGDEQPRHRHADRAARRHRALRRRERHDGPRADGAGRARHPPPARRVHLQAAARARPRARTRRRRRLRHEELPLSRMDPAAVRGAQARPAGALAGRSRRGVRHGRAGPRHRGDARSSGSPPTAACWRST